VLKYRIEFKSSRLSIFFKLLIYAIFIFSVLSWQSDSIPYQFLLQMLGLSFIFVCLSKTYNSNQKQPIVIFSQAGEWLEVNEVQQVEWRMTNKSRVSNFLLFIHLISPLNPSHSKWRLVYVDQVTKRDFRRLCRAVIHQQQSNVAS